MFCFLLLLRQGSSLPSPNLGKKMHGAPPLNFFLFSSCSFFCVIVVDCSAAFWTDGMLRFEEEKMCSQLLKNCSHRRRLVVVQFRKMTICQVNRQATFFKIVLYISKCVWGGAHDCSLFMHYTVYSRMFEVTFDIFVLRTLTTFLLIWIWKIFYFSAVRSIFFTHFQLLFISWAALDTAMPCILISWFYNFQFVFCPHLSPSLFTLPKYLDDGLHLICLDTQTSSERNATT